MMTPEEYLKHACNSIAKPRLQESTAIHRQFQKLADYILGGDFDEFIYTIDCYTTEVYPRLIYFPKYNYNLMAWDNHFWDIYGRFLHMYFTYINVGSILPQEFFINYFESMLLAYLANRCEKYPAFSRYLAEEYSKLDMKYPPYNEYEDINDILNKIGYQQEFNVAKIFGFCHEIAHMAFEKKNKVSQEIQKQVIEYCELVDKFINVKREIEFRLDEKVDSDDEEYMLNIVRRLLDNTDMVLLEEVCCDIIAVLVLSKFFSEECGMTHEQIATSLSSIYYFYRCTWWLSTSEKFWSGLREVYTNIENDDAFCNQDNPYYRFGEKITDEYAVRTNFVFSFCSEKLELDIMDNRIREEFHNSGFQEILEQAIGVRFMDNVLIKTRNAKKDIVHAIAHQQKKNQFIGWENSER